mmetsp:Transcript_23932/g.76838  ORF Transcript_23932/g.76838 Transcript_23932/m.76838 type:complete len:219 (-) Transcript_23932:141-797(-)
MRRATFMNAAATRQRRSGSWSGQEVLCGRRRRSASSSSWRCTLTACRRLRALRKCSRHHSCEQPLARKARSTLTSVRWSPSRAANSECMRPACSRLSLGDTNGESTDSMASSATASSTHEKRGASSSSLAYSGGSGSAAMRRPMGVTSRARERAPSWSRCTSARWMAFGEGGSRKSNFSTCSTPNTRSCSTTVSRATRCASGTAAGRSASKSVSVNRR